jgi:hypothetical protein
MTAAVNRMLRSLRPSSVCVGCSLCLGANLGANRCGLVRTGMEARGHGSSPFQAVWTTVDAYGHRLEIHGWSGGEGFEFLRVCRSSCPHWESVALGPNPKRPIVRAVGYCVPTSIRPKRWFRRLSAR